MPQGLIKPRLTFDVTASQSHGRQDIVAKTATAGSRFYTTGGEMLNSDDYFIAEERKQRSIKVNELKIKKEKLKNRTHKNQKPRLSSIN